jgi:hypothetical protein
MPTIHPEDPEYSVRLFSPEELKEAARSLARRPVGLNHETLINDAFTVDAQWNESTQAIEALLFLPTHFIDMIRAKEIDKVSVEYVWRSEKKTEKGTEFEGLIFDRIDLLYHLNAGDKGTEIRLIESKKRLLEGEIAIMNPQESEQKQKNIQDSIDDESLSFFKDELEEAATQFDKRLGEPLHADFQKVKSGMISQYGKDKGTQVFWAWVNKHGYDETKPLPKKTKKEAEVLLPSGLKVDKQVPEETNQMRNPVDDSSVIHQPPVSPAAPIPNVGTVGFIPEPNKGEPVIVGFKGESDKLSQSTPIGGNVMDIIDQDKSKQRTESATPPTPAPAPTDKPQPANTPQPAPVQQPSIEKPVQAPVPSTSTPTPVPAPAKDPTPPSVDKDKRIKELEEAVGRLQTNAQNTEKDKNKAISDATTKIRTELVEKLESKLPPTINTYLNATGQALATDIRKIVYELKESTEK